MIKPTKQKPANKKNMEKCRKDLARLKREIAPFSKSRKFKVVSTIGRWREGNVAMIDHAE